MKEDILIQDTLGYYAAPDKPGQYPGLVLIEEIWGLNDHIKGVVDRLAAEGFCVVSVELIPEESLSKLTPEMQPALFDPAQRNEVQPKVRAAMQPTLQPEFAARALQKLQAAIDFLVKEKGVKGKIGVMGFCFGGTYSFHLAAHDSRIAAAVPFYGHAPAVAELAGLHCPILAFYGDQDAGLMQTLPELKEQMGQAGKQFEPVVYAGAGHAFFNDTNPVAYRPEAAADAWHKALTFLHANLG